MVNRRSFMGSVAALACSLRFCEPSLGAKPVTDRRALSSSEGAIIAELERRRRLAEQNLCLLLEDMIFGPANEH